MILPHKLSQGSTIGIFSPSEPITAVRRSRFARGISILEGHGYQVITAPNAFAQDSYMAGTVAQRVDDIHTLCESTKVDALMASWGGKSANQLLGDLDFDLIARERKSILGFSDGCVLLNAITARTGLVTFYGPNVAGKLHETLHSDLALLRQAGGSGGLSNLLGSPNGVDSRVLRAGEVAGRLFGGNLSTFVLGCVASNVMPKFQPGGILFWESASEPIQIVDQLLSCLENAGIFQDLAGMIVGDFIHDDPTLYRFRDPFKMLIERTERYGFPVVYCPTFGHPETLENPVLPIGALCQLSTRDMMLRLLEPVVE